MNIINRLHIITEAYFAGHIDVREYYRELDFWSLLRLQQNGMYRLLALYLEQKEHIPCN